jgi:hypothetical protein
MSVKQCLEGQVYSVPLIQSDLRREEAVHQIADALLYLETISTDIFTRYAHTEIEEYKLSNKSMCYMCCLVAKILLIYSMPAGVENILVSQIVLGILTQRLHWQEGCST